MADRADGISNRRHVQHASQAVGFVALAGLMVGAVLTAGSLFGGGLAASAASSVKTAHMPLDTTTPTATPGCGLWNIVNSPNVGASPNELKKMAVVSAGDIWAVGDYNDTVTAHAYQTLIEHWDGTQWSVVPSPNVGTGDNHLYDVAAVSANDVWAVGTHTGPYSTIQTLALRWDGTTWNVVSTPNVAVAYNFLRGVSAVSADDVWAVGCAGDCGGGGAGSAVQTLTEHWDGSAWSIVPSPNVQGVPSSFLLGVTHISTNNVWAVGGSNPCPGCVVSTLFLHWDGSSWSIVPSPNQGTSTNGLQDILAISADDIWAVGNYTPGTGPAQTLTLHYNGAQWGVVPSPNRNGFGASHLWGLAATASNDVWAVGEDSVTPGLSLETLVEHWGGAQWTIVPSANITGQDNVLWGVASVSSSDVWAAGYTGNQTLVERFDNPCPPTATPTYTPSRTPTITGTPPTSTPTNTPTSTPTPCEGCPTILGHLTWQGVAPANRPLVTGTLQLCVSGSPQTFNFTTDTGGYFTVTYALPDGTYHWRTKGGRHLSNSSPADGPDLVIVNGYATLEFGQQRGGNSNTDNVINSTDFNAIKTQFGLGGARSADFNYNNAVDAADFAIQKSNFGQASHVLTCP